MALSSNSMQVYGYDLLLGFIAAFYVFMAPFTKVEESFNVQAMHDILYHRHHIEQYDHLEFPGVVPRTFIGSILVSALASPVALAASLLQYPKLYSLYAVRLALGFIILSSLRFFRIQIRKNFGSQVEAFFVILTAIQFHMLFYCTRPLPNILAFGLVNLAYGYWFQRRFYAALNSLVFATIVFRCDILLLVSPLGLELLLTRSISLRKAVISCVIAASFFIGLTVMVDSVMWRRMLWPELEVFWFNSVLNRSSEWGIHAFHWYFTSALPRSLLVAYPLSVLGLFLDRRIRIYVIPVLSFVTLYSKLPHKELRFIISALPIFNLSAAIAASRIYNNRKKSLWKYLNIAMLGLFLISLGCTILTFMASYENYPSAHALNALHKMGYLEHNPNDSWVHIDTFSAMNGISRFCENHEPWRYSKEEGIPIQEFQQRNFTYLLSEHAQINGYKCLLSTTGFSGTRLHVGFPPISLVKKPKVYVHGNTYNDEIIHRNWPGC
ncbi:dol-P-Man:Man(7)GlcNAc(2)-PP-Dol alpha-1,6-mannosyltransferase-like [Salvia splendens]|uniref:dol-P-Man:Man(7)GlcNAc(2)-PP-Dol alpha-1,6-mannosyltransferase-like n=1 Tax=Salvia splendens TaxID=180675 RepID=UPI001101755B|nr:dol-P-Man:Man(7)GlcNAc(2)-PP-Dol alpha-1,6-mannosyltransferase-like [Salvia splendens]XP_042064324.1 dol-P-Man:Man(7)GlcNAc(2)-PP-Dol alpha-1,6-mannosyltransferase-like [Salvia splendens]